MRTFSWKHPVILVAAAAIAAACSSDTTPTPATDGGGGADAGKCGTNKKIDPGEDCDKSASSPLGGKSCSSVTMMAKPNGTLACKSDCIFDISGCTAAGGGGGGGGAA